MLQEFGELPDFSEDEVQRIPIRPELPTQSTSKRILNARAKDAIARALADLGLNFRERF